MIKGGPKIINDGLVLCLDAHDAKSYAGEPTTNLAASAGYPNFSNWVAEGTAEKISAGYNFQGQPVYKCNTSVGLSYQGIWRTITGLRTAASGGSVTVSVWVKNPNSTSYNFYAYIGHDFSSTRTLEANSDWQRIEWTVLESSMANDYVEYRPYTNTAGVYIHMTMPQVEVKTYATPWVDGSRSTTDAWIDRSGNSSHGDFYNGLGTGASHYRDGQVIMPVANSYLEFDGTNDSIVIDDVSNISLTSGSVEAWVKMDSISGNKVIVAYGGNGTNTGWLLQSENSTSNKIGFLVFGAASAYSGNTLSTGYLNNWTHFIGTYGGGAVKFYANGALVTSTATSTNVSSSSTLRVGNEYNRSYFLDGQLGLVRIYNKTLTAAEVLSNYNATKERF